MCVRPRARGVHEPVVNLKLDPRGRKDIESGGRLERRAGQKLEADGPRIGIQEVGRVGKRLAERDVSSEAGAGAPHVRARGIVERAVNRAAGNGLGRRRALRAPERRFLRVVQILLAKLVAELDQFHPGDSAGKVEPFTITNAVEGHDVTPAEVDLPPSYV